MPRVVNSAEKLDEQLHIPVSKSFKRRLIKMAKKHPMKPKPTHFARTLIEQAIDEAEAKPSSAAAVG